MAEQLGIVDPRLLHEQADVELLTLWAGHFSLKRDRTNGPAEPAPHLATPVSVDQQVSKCERLLMM